MKLLIVSKFLENWNLEVIPKNALVCFEFLFLFEEGYSYCCFYLNSK